METVAEEPKGRYSPIERDLRKTGSKFDAARDKKVSTFTFCRQLRFRPARVINKWVYNLWKTGGLRHLRA